MTTGWLWWRFRLDCAELIHARRHLVYTRFGWILEHVCQDVEVVSDPACEISLAAVGGRAGVHHVTECLHTAGDVSRLGGDLSAGCLFGRKFAAADVVGELLFSGW